MAARSGPVQVPPKRVLEAFRVHGELDPLPGGQRPAWRCGDVVLKPLDTSEQMLEWQSRVLTPLTHLADLRVAPPLRASDGSMVVEDWTAWPYLSGSPARGRWSEVAAAGARFHTAMAHVPRPSFLDERTDHWAVADRVAWGELPLSDYSDVWGMAMLGHRLRHVDAAPQLIHGDLSGNVLLHLQLPPAVIDFSPYWRPPEYATAVVAADALLWHGADAGALDVLTAIPSRSQMLLRAMIFRLVTEARGSAAGGATVSERYSTAIRIGCEFADLH
ncbi:MAG TPA: hypothetical protein VKE25_07250 [Actinomycetes bacterium]|nr:hypothetical protein [Actinomycetes bacterium]